MEPCIRDRRSDNASEYNHMCHGNGTGKMGKCGKAHRLQPVGFHSVDPRFAATRSLRSGASSACRVSDARLMPSVDSAPRKTALWLVFAGCTLKEWTSRSGKSILASCDFRPVEPAVPTRGSCTDRSGSTVPPRRGCHRSSSMRIQTVCWRSRMVSHGRPGSRSWLPARQFRFL